MQGCLAGATECARNSATFVGASLLAIALGLTSVDVNVMAPSPAGSLPQWSMSLVHAQVQLIDHSRPVGIFAQLFFQERRLLRVPEIGSISFLSSASGEWLAMKSSMALSLESRPSWSNRPFKSWVGESIFISLLVESRQLRTRQCSVIASERAARQEFDMGWRALRNRDK